MKTYTPAACLILALTCLPHASAQPPDPPADPFADFTRAWRDDPVWYDGLAEYAIYDATRTIYGKRRDYTARILTNKEHASAKTFTKSADGTGRAVFKHHVRDDIPTQAYTYHYSTMAYIGTDDLKSLKIDMGSLEDCGATFKQYINHAGTLSWRQHSYFPDEGERAGELTPRQNFAFHDALTLILRGYPFNDPPKTLELQLLREQTDTHLTPPNELAAGVALVRYRGRETLELPAGAMEAHHLVLDVAPGWQEHYWFAADPPMLNILLRYEGPKGQSYLLRSVERRAYWRR